MNFIKNNSYDITRLFINQIGITIFSLVLYLSTGFVEDTVLRGKLWLMVSIGATLFYFALLYCASWEFGAKDKIRIDSGKYKKVPMKGALMSLLANSLNIILALVSAICIGVYINTPTLQGAESAVANAAGITSMLSHFISAMFIGIVGLFKSIPVDEMTVNLLDSLGYLAMYLVTVGVTQLGYFMGERNYRISSLFGVQSNQANRK